ncbi:lysine-N-methylase [Massilia sp. UYP32]|jgi:lysine-N-methylase|uniref:Lysine-N-methylase n=1 Tax=Massilia timonae CCUG 45783 TaxID=883126 RepID=K9DFF1_9BURK|nr:MULTISPECIES: flagellin lysine-N-methylase [Massilia]EKU82923.1 hypothetical protein HMPREF9710_01934 [Massilia timonae CCUG 45783]QYG04181.1 flagellin lysine-N-methylase [Massilia sp. NP310]
MPILHRTQTLSALMPRFVERFRCIGPSCEDTCCSGWIVQVDKKTYKAYRKESVPALENMVANTVRLDEMTSNGGYAVIRPVGELKQCPALADGMCSVQSNLGESYLPNVCHSYPRTNRRLHGQVEQTITLSCPEAARLALLAEDAFEFVETPVHLRGSALLEVSQCAGVTPELMVETRIFCLNLMRTRELALWQRLAILGTFCDALTHLCIRNEQATIPALINDFVHLIENGELLATLNSIQPNHEAQAMVFATLWAAKGFDTVSPFQKSMIEQIASKFGADVYGQVSAERLVTAYRHGLERLDEALLEAPWFLENYVVNEMFSQLVPFNGNNPYESYLRLIARFGLLRTLLAVQCNTAGDVPPLATLAATAQMQCRRFQHDPAYSNRVKDSLFESGWAEMSKLYTLLRT